MLLKVDAMKKFVFILLVASLILISAAQIGMANTGVTGSQQKSQVNAGTINERSVSPSSAITGKESNEGNRESLIRAGTIPTQIIVFKPTTTVLAVHVGDTMTVHVKLIRSDTGDGIAGASLGASVSFNGTTWINVPGTMITDSNGEIGPITFIVPDPRTFGYPVPPLPITGYGKSIYAGDGTFMGSETAVYRGTVLPPSPSPSRTPAPTPTPTPHTTPSLSITSARLVPGYTQYLELGIANAGTADARVAPNAFLYKPTDMAPGYAQDGAATVHTVGLTSDSDTGPPTVAYPGDPLRGA